MPVVAGYLLVVGGNSAAFGYNFWTDIPPSSAADGAAVISLWALFVGTSFVAAAAYGWMCDLAVQQGTRATAAGARRALRRTARGAPVAVPAMAVTVAVLPLWLPVIPLVALFGALPYRTQSAGIQARRLPGLCRSTSSDAPRNWGRHLIGCISRRRGLGRWLRDRRSLQRTGRTCRRSRWVGGPLSRLTSCRRRRHHVPPDLAGRRRVALSGARWQPGAQRRGGRGQSRSIVLTVK